MSTFNIKINSNACGIGSRLVLVLYKYPLGSIVYVCQKASKHGELEALVVTSVQFVKNPKFSYPAKNSYLILYNGIYYEDQLCDEVSAKALALAYWNAQEDLVLSQLGGIPC